MIILHVPDYHDTHWNALLYICGVLFYIINIS